MSRSGRGATEMPCSEAAEAAAEADAAVAAADDDDEDDDDEEEEDDDEDEEEEDDAISSPRQDRRRGSGTKKACFLSRRARLASAALERAFVVEESQRDTYVSYGAAFGSVGQGRKQLVRSTTLAREWSLYTA